MRGLLLPLIPRYPPTLRGMALAPLNCDPPLRALGRTVELPGIPPARGVDMDGRLRLTPPRLAPVLAGVESCVPPYPGRPAPL